MITKINLKDRSIKSYAIRKLTPRECFRLMGIDDHTIDVMQQTTGEARATLGDYAKGVKRKENEMAISTCQQYKQAGNSIVVDVLTAIYEQLWYPKREPRKRENMLMDLLYPDDVIPDAPCDPNPSRVKRIITTFSGYDSQLMACDALKQKHPDFQWTCDGWSDIDKYACQMHNLVFPQFADKALGDITQVDWHAVKQQLNDSEVDLFTYSSPCQDISLAGRQMGLTEGSNTRSALLWKVADAVEVLRPKYLLQENVSALVSQTFMPDFQRWLDRLSALGYVNRWARLNAKDYGVPQNRDRVFCVSMRKDVAFDFQFPQPMELKKCLADMLEDTVSASYFLKDETVYRFLEQNEKDEVLFLQYSVPPTHEDAMFLKTWLQLWIKDNDGFNLSLQTLKRRLDEAKATLMMQHKAWAEQGAFPDSRFAELFDENRKPKDVTRS